MIRAANPVHPMQCRCRACKPGLEIRRRQPSIARRFARAADPADLAAVMWGAALGVGFAAIVLIAKFGPRLIAAITS
ncbi:hypothetical protein SAMN06295912_102277 [Sphingomonas laterariae]|uniref:Uncharacterized protein n=1 Tax=Edaphosphingomonas laterariae TaxID=861865 RepID=A0A239CNP1_9SPHN|nr:hypothetical protein [Sphingomonas laterariae]SNS20963.1 hypothetical protein SAMN06295912_102277 [Sphingomonas laterariae]